MQGLNLARDPFLNKRPIRRIAALLWVLAVALLAVNGWSYWRHFVGQDRQQSELAELEPKIAEERQRLDSALDSLTRYDLSWQSEQVEFLNAKIAERTFSWSALFDHLSEVLPRNVRIERVTPHLTRTGHSRARPALRGPEDEVELEFTGAAEKDEALLVLIDAFFAHERFRRPNLKVESRSKDGSEVGFSMTVTYKPVAPRPRQRDNADEDEEAREAPAAAAPEEAATESTAGVSS